MPKIASLKIFLLSFLLVFAGSSLVFFVPKAVSESQRVLVSSQIEIPANNTQVLGIEKYVYPPTANGLAVPFLTARSVLIKDLTTDTLLFQKLADNRVPIASTTKIMTALVASEYYQPASILQVNIGASIPGSRVGLQVGERLTFRSLLYGMLLNSGNDAAYTIAENYPGGVSGFVAAMNQKALALNLENTHFDNPVGFDSPYHYSSASDLAKITEEALKNDSLAKIFATKGTSISTVDKKETFQLANLNILLSKVPGVIGVKTGFTDAAKENLVGLVDRNGHRVLTVVLGSDDRFGETTKLIDWTYANYTWR